LIWNNAPGFIGSAKSRSNAGTGQFTVEIAPGFEHKKTAVKFDTLIYYTYIAMKTQFIEL
jgi:hypothetical protein